LCWFDYFRSKSSKYNFEIDENADDDEDDEDDEDADNDDDEDGIFNQCDNYLNY